MSDLKKVVGVLEELASPTASAIAVRFSDRTRPRLAMLLIDAGSVAARKAVGEDTSTAEVALEASFRNISLEERTMIQAAGKDLLIRALLQVAGIIAGA